jgi:quinoprotein dehydrogenase-associated probable ABC transporter substrate-binding protein
MKPLVWWLAGWWCALCGIAHAATPTLANGQSQLRVCQDPNNMPFSNQRGEGLENKLAELMAKTWEVPLTYHAFPQRMGFIRNTLRYKLPGEDYPCDIVMGVPAGFEQVASTRAYYRSSYALVFPLGKGLDQVQSVDDFLKLAPDVLRRLRIGVFDRSPASEWLSRHGLADAGVPYRLLNADPASHPGQIIERDLAQGQIDVAVVWGPMAAYFAKRVQSPALRWVPMRSEPGVTLEFDMAMGVRHGEPAWKAQVELFLQNHADAIQAVLTAFDVPLLETRHAKP